MRGPPGASAPLAAAPRRVSSCLPAACIVLLSPALAAAQTPPPAATTSQTPLWTQVPTRIDRSKDTRPRIETPAPPPGFLVAGDGRTDIAGRLILDGRSYRIFGLEPIEPGRLCTAQDGRRWACGGRARARLSALVVGRILRCRHVGDPDAADPVVDCRAPERTLTELMVEAGYGGLNAEGAAVPALAKALDGARRARVGIWSTLPPP